MDKLWAPWRMQYISAFGKTDDGCIFCVKPTQNNDRENLILARGTHCFVIMNLFPYNNGHLMIVPYRHTSDINGLKDEVVCELWEYTQRAVAIITKAFRAEGFNIGLNLGRAAGAGIDQHIHQHIVPRWNSDTNFMPVISDTKVISQGLFEAYDSLLPYFNGSADADIS